DQKTILRGGSLLGGKTGSVPHGNQQTVFAQTHIMFADKLSKTCEPEFIRKITDKALNYGASPKVRRKG
ncbi:hypothetical protein SB748_23235, partial [Rhizobium sp. SIMBA_035]